MTSSRPRAIIVEDEALIAMHLQEILEDTGLAVVALFRSAELALAGLNDAAPDVAVLDVNLSNNKTSLPIAEKLTEAGIPFLFLTGYGKAGAEGEFPGVPVLSKPVSETELSRAIRSLLPADGGGRVDREDNAVTRPLRGGACQRPVDLMNKSFDDPGS